jgi:hypothetical protein
MSDPATLIREAIRILASELIPEQPNPPRHGAAMNPRAVVVEEVEHLLSFGQPAPSIAKALGIREGSVARALLRAGRPDLAGKFERERRASEAHQCLDCSAPVACPKALRCRSCGYRERERVKHAGQTHCDVPGCRRYLSTDGRCRDHGRAAA